MSLSIIEQLMRVFTQTMPPYEFIRCFDSSIALDMVSSVSNKSNIAHTLAAILTFSPALTVLLGFIAGPNV